MREIDGVRNDLYAISDELETVKMMLARLPSHAYLCRTVFMATASMWALIGVVILLTMR